MKHVAIVVIALVAAMVLFGALGLMDAGAEGHDPGEPTSTPGAPTKTPPPCPPCTWPVETATPEAYGAGVGAYPVYEPVVLR